MILLHTITIGDEILPNSNIETGGLWVYTFLAFSYLSCSTLVKGVNPKIGGKTPQIIHFNRVWNHYFHHPFFWGVSPPIFGFFHPYAVSIWSN